MPAFWILKSDPEVYPFSRFLEERRTVWDGVSNPVALRHLGSMAPGDRALIYHSNVGKDLVGLARVVSRPYPDPKRKDPKLLVVDLEAERALPRPVPLAAVKADPAFADLGLVRMPRLSVIPVTPPQWRRLLELAGLGS